MSRPARAAIALTGGAWVWFQRVNANDTLGANQTLAAWQSAYNDLRSLFPTTDLPRRLTVDGVWGSNTAFAMAAVMLGGLRVLTDDSLPESMVGWSSARGATPANAATIFRTRLWPRFGCNAGANCRPEQLLLAEFLRRTIDVRSSDLRPAVARLIQSYADEAWSGFGSWATPGTPPAADPVVIVAPIAPPPSVPLPAEPVTLPEVTVEGERPAPVRTSAWAWVVGLGALAALGLGLTYGMKRRGRR